MHRGLYHAKKEVGHSTFAASGQPVSHSGGIAYYSIIYVFSHTQVWIISNFFSTQLYLISSEKSSMIETVLCAYNLDLFSS